MLEKDYATHGTCSKRIHIALDDSGKIMEVTFEGGCPGNLQGIGKLVTGMPAAEVARRLRGTRCGYKQTSCPDQLALALDEMLASHPESGRGE